MNATAESNLLYWRLSQEQLAQTAFSQQTERISNTVKSEPFLSPQPKNFNPPNTATLYNMGTLNSNDCTDATSPMDQFNDIYDSTETTSTSSQNSPFANNLLDCINQTARQSMPQFGEDMQATFEVTSNGLDDDNSLFPDLAEFATAEPERDVITATVSSTAPKEKLSESTERDTERGTEQTHSSSVKKKREQNGNGSSIEVMLLHKPRGCRGIWQPVESGNALRVTKGKGKWLKLEVKSSEHHFGSSDINVFLLDVSDENHPPPGNIQSLVHGEDEGISVETINTASDEADENCIVDVELKLDRVSKKLQFFVAVKAETGSFVGKSVEFSAHNNGKASAKKRLSDDSSSSSPHSSGASSPHTPVGTSAPIGGIGTIVPIVSPSSTPALFSGIDIGTTVQEQSTTRNSPPSSQSGYSVSESGYLGMPMTSINMKWTQNPPTSTPDFQQKKRKRNGAEEFEHPYSNQEFPLPLNYPLETMSVYASQSQSNLGSHTASQHAQQHFVSSLFADTLHSSHTPTLVPRTRSPENNNMQSIGMNHQQNTISPVSNLNSSPQNHSQTANIPRIYHMGTTSQVHQPSYQSFHNSQNYSDTGSSDVITIPSSLRVEGSVAARVFLQFSDLRLKTNIRDLNDAINIISQLKGKTYTWRRDSYEEQISGGNRVIGLIAQEVQKILPEVVHEDSNGYLSVSYTELVPVLIEAFKEQLRQYEDDKEEVQLQLKELHEKLDKIPLLEVKDGDTSSFQRWADVAMGNLKPEEKKPAGKIPFNRKKSVLLKSGVKTAVIILFLIGLCGIMFGSIMLGITLSRASPTAHVTVVSADLVAAKNDTIIDPYCEVEIGAQVFRTFTAWGQLHPEFDETFDGKLDPSISEIVFQVYDDGNTNQTSQGRRIGFARILLKDEAAQRTHQQVLPLQGIANTSEENFPPLLSGEITVSLYITPRKKPGYELAFLVTGVLLLFASLILGFFLWRAQRFEAIPKQ